jgi:hypothetical protein
LQYRGDGEDRETDRNSAHTGTGADDRRIHASVRVTVICEVVVVVVGGAVVGPDRDREVPVGTVVVMFVPIGTVPVRKSSVHPREGRPASTPRRAGRAVRRPLGVLYP